MSINGSNPSCEDLFHGDVEGTPSFFHAPCSTIVRGRKGLFLATHCIKLVAYTPGKFRFFSIKILKNICYL
jgi:hypothetical protein